jgi:hypothetical protein
MLLLQIVVSLEVCDDTVGDSRDIIRKRGGWIWKAEYWRPKCQEDPSKRLLEIASRDVILD